MTNAIRPNRLKELLGAGKVAVGLACFTLHPALIEIMGWSGFDFIFIDTEHVAADEETTLAAIRACEIAGMTPLVRVYENSPALIGKALDSGAQGVIIPHVTRAEQAEAAVRSAKYPPLGERGACPSIRPARFGLLPWKEYSQRANEDNLVIILVEGEEGMKNMPEILKVKGIDVMFFGPVDFSQSIGLPGETYEHPKLYAALRDLVGMCGKAGIPVMTVTSPASNAALAKKLIDAGVRVVSLSTDEVVFRQACQELLKVKGL